MTTNNFDSNTSEHTDIKIDIGSVDVDWLDYSSVNTTLGTYTVAKGVTGSPWAVGSASSIGITDFNYPTNSMRDTGRIELRGEGADIDINGTSLKDFMERVESRLGLLTPDSRLEKEWAELKTLGDRYRELEKEIHSRMKTFDILKKE